MGTGIVLLILFVISIFAVKGCVRRFRYGCCDAGGERVKKAVSSDADKSHYAHQYTLSVEGMSCKNCAIRIENAFNQKEGFYAEVNLKHKKAQVWTSEEVDESVLRVEVARAGYACVSVEKVR